MLIAADSLHVAQREGGKYGSRPLRACKQYVLRMQVEVTTPEEHMGDVIGDLNSRRGLVGEFLDKPGNMRVRNPLFLSC